MAKRVSVEIEGLRELKRSFRGVARDAETTEAKAREELKQAGKRAADLVANEARRRAPVGETGRLQGSIKSFGTTAGGRVKGGKKTVPYFGFVDFGGKVTQRTKSGGTRVLKRPFLREGRIIYPALAAKRDQAVRLYKTAVEDILRKNGLRPD